LKIKYISFCSYAVLHLLAKEGKAEILRNLLDDSRVEDRLVGAVLAQDKLGWNAIMAATKSGLRDGGNR